jgi:hypothetical protein
MCTGVDIIFKFNFLTKYFKLMLKNTNRFSSGRFTCTSHLVSDSTNSRIRVCTLYIPDTTPAARVVNSTYNAKAALYYRFLE